MHSQSETYTVAHTDCSPQSMPAAAWCIVGLQLVYNVTRNASGHSMTMTVIVTHPGGGDGDGCRARALLTLARLAHCNVGGPGQWKRWWTGAGAG
jgi:hypothetical protein